MNRNVSVEAARRAQVALKCVDSLLPGATALRGALVAAYCRCAGKRLRGSRSGTLKI